MSHPALRILGATAQAHPASRRSRCAGCTDCTCESHRPKLGESLVVIGARTAAARVDSRR